MDIFNKDELKQARSNDLAAIQQLLQANQLPHEDITAEKLNHYRVIWERNTLIGAIGLENYEHHGLLRSLVVRENYQNKGIGRLLVSKLEEYAKSIAVRELYLLTTTADSFFNRLNYVEIARNKVPESIRNCKEFSSICPDSAIVMKKDL